MNCTDHIQNPITLVCIAPHKCQCYRKLCVECQYEHGEDLKNTVPIKIFRDKVIQKLKEQNLDQTSELTKQRISFKSLLSQTERMLKKIWEDLSNSIQQIYDMIEMEDNSNLKILNDNINPAELSNTDLEKLVQIVEGQQLNDWDAKKNSYLEKLEKTQNWWDQEVKAFSEKLQKEIQEVQQLIKSYSRVQLIQQEDYVYEKIDDLYEILVSLKDQEVQIFNLIIERLENQKISDIQGFQQWDDIQKHINVVGQGRQKILNFIRNINEHEFNKSDYSSDIYLKSKEDQLKEQEMIRTSSNC